MATLTLQLRAAEVLDHILPIRRVVEPAQVGLELAAQNLEGRALADTVGSHETQDVAGPGHGKTVKLEAVGGIAMGDLTLEVRWQVDNGDGAKGATLRADTTTDAKLFGNEGDARLGGHLYGVSLDCAVSRRIEGRTSDVPQSAQSISHVLCHAVGGRGQNLRKACRTGPRGMTSCILDGISSPR